jgi:uncharacterized repeat protein (TIGR01451 family)
MIEIAVRVLLVSIIVFSAVAPTTALAKSGKSSAQESMIETSSNSPAALLQQQPIYFDTPEVISPQQTSPEPEKVKSPVPAKDPVEFTLVADPAIIPATGIISFDVRIRNNSGQALTSLVFTDSLESGLEYSQDNVSPVAFDTSKKEISLRVLAQVKSTVSAIH